jgi:hypothetical protein
VPDDDDDNLAAPPVLMKLVTVVVVDAGSISPSVASVELSTVAGEKNASAGLQADSIQFSEKTESDSSTSVETEKSDD